MKHVIYLVGQISYTVPETYRWREVIQRSFEYSKVSHNFQIINPCDSEFDKNHGKDGSDLMSSIYLRDHIGLIVPKDYDAVIRSHICVANLNHYDKSRPLIGSFYELAWYYCNPNKTVIGIFDGDWKKDINAGHPFVRASIHTWVKSPIDACRLITEMFSNE